MAKKNETAAAPATPTNTAVAVVAAQPAASSSLSKLFMLDETATKALAGRKLTRLTLPPMFTPKEIPEGGVVSGTIQRVVNSPVTTIKGKLLVLKHDNGTEFMFPVTGVIKQAIAPGAEDKDLQKTLESHIGKYFVAKSLGTKKSTKGLRDMYLFDVALSD